jgi:hypothetical protein
MMILVINIQATVKEDTMKNLGKDKEGPRPHHTELGGVD